MCLCLKRADLTVGIMSDLSYASPTVQFTMPFYQTQLIAMVAMSEDQQSMQTWLLTTPLSSTLWIALSASLFVFLAAFYTAECFLFHQKNQRNYCHGIRCYSNDQDVTSSLSINQHESRVTVVNQRRIIRNDALFYFDFNF